MNVVSIILARGGSKAIPKKNIMDFCGTPLIGWTIDCCLKSKYVTKTYVTTDDQKIIDVASSYDVEIIKRPDDISGDTADAESAVLHALTQIDMDIDYIIMPQVTSPLRTFNDIDNAMEQILKDDGDSLFSMCLLNDYCIWNDNMESVTYNYKNRGRRQDRSPHYLENGSLYIFKPDVIKNNNNRLGGKISMYQMPFWKSYEIDEMDDIDICKHYMEKEIIHE